jgi:hypothetical protein
VPTQIQNCCIVERQNHCTDNPLQTESLIYALPPQLNCRSDLAFSIFSSGRKATSPLLPSGTSKVLVYVPKGVEDGSEERVHHWHVIIFHERDSCIGPAMQMGKDSDHPARCPRDEWNHVPDSKIQLLVG